MVAKRRFSGSDARLPVSIREDAFRRQSGRESTMDDVTHAVLAEIGLDEPWGLVEVFARQPREKPDDANRGADLLIERLRRHGIPVTVHQPEIFLSLPIRAEVRAGGRSFAAKPPAFAANRPDGVTAPLLHLPAAGGGTRSIATRTRPAPR